MRVAEGAVALTVVVFSQSRYASGVAKHCGGRVACELLDTRSADMSNDVTEALVITSMGRRDRADR